MIQAVRMVSYINLNCQMRRIRNVKILIYSFILDLLMLFFYFFCFLYHVACENK